MVALLAFRAVRVADRTCYFFIYIDCFHGLKAEVMNQAVPTISANRFSQFIHLVCPFPRYVRIVFSEVTVIGGLRINRSEQIELLDDIGGLEAENLRNFLLD